LEDDMSKKAKIFIAMLVVISGLVGYQVYYTRHRTNEIAMATKTYEDSLEKSIKATLSLYYTVERKYPRTTDDLFEELAKSAPTLDTRARDPVDKLKDFEYTVRGDYQSYKITYTDSTGNMHEVLGNYKEDYH
jgi:hypothetical protein